MQPSPPVARRLTVLVLGLALGAALHAAEPAAAPVAAAPAAVEAAARDLRVTRLLGREVRSADGAVLGELKDLVVDLHDGALRYAVLSLGGELDLRDRLFACPATALHGAGPGHDLVLQLDRAALRRAPGFERTRWPAWDGAFTTRVDRHFGLPATPAPAPALARLSELIGRDVQDRQGAAVGEIDELVLDLRQQRLRYVVLDFERRWSDADKLMALPLAALRLGDAGRGDATAVLQLGREQLDMGRGFDIGHWPDLNDAAWRRDLEGWLERLRVAALAPR